jgi:hypothetical protein
MKMLMNVGLTSSNNIINIMCLNGANNKVMKGKYLTYRYPI